MASKNENIRNIAIIAHVDHGKTTLVDNMFKQSGLFRSGQAVSDRLMDSMELERERGITIAAKNCSIRWKDRKINIIDTPGHADFGGEVERALSMADGALLLVDASEGPLPQTRFVLSKSFKLGLPVIVVINKIDRKDARCEQVHDEILDLFIDLGADDDQLEFPLLYAIGRDGIAKRTLSEESENLHVLLDTIIHQIPPPAYDEDEPFQMLVSDLGYSDYLGRLAIGKIVNGRVQDHDALICLSENEQHNLKVSKLQSYQGLSFAPVSQAETGDIVVLSGIDRVTIGDTICTREFPKALPRIQVDEPTLAMRITINSSPMRGMEGKYVQSSRIAERLRKETLMNVAIRIEEENEGFIVKGRGELQLAILVETMRREGFELSVGRPEVIFKQVDEKRHEPIEAVTIDCEDLYMGLVTEKLLSRKAKMMNMHNNGSGRVRLELSVPARALIGYRDEFLTDTKGTGIINSYFLGYEEYRGHLETRHNGSLVADRSGVGVAYALFNLEPRGELFITPGEPVYEGMVVGEHSRENDLNVNPTKGKKLTNMRASGKDEAVALSPIKPMTLERAMHFIRDDELVEVTPTSIRLRKITLAANQRHIWRHPKKVKRA
jgi:GTP-binding protein